jgi:transposase
MNTKRLVSDELGALAEPLLPAEHPKPNGGRPRVPNRSALEGIVYVLRSGIPWRMLPREISCSGVTWAKPFAGAASAIGRRRACGRACGGCCSTGLEGWAASTLPALPEVLATTRHKGAHSQAR